MRGSSSTIRIVFNRSSLLRPRSSVGSVAMMPVAPPEQSAEQQEEEQDEEQREETESESPRPHVDVLRSWRRRGQNSSALERSVLRAEVVRGDRDAGRNSKREE